MSPAPDEHDRIRAAMERIKIVKLKELRDKDATELAQLRADVDHLVRAVNQLTVENRQLRGALSQPSSPVRALPPQPRPNERDAT
jgi:regulator of replication initiation timing